MKQYHFYTNFLKSTIMQVILSHPNPVLVSLATKASKRSSTIYFILLLFIFESFLFNLTLTNLIIS